MKIDVHKIAMAAPNDVSGLQSLICTGAVDPATIVAVIGKTEGNGGANDFTRGFATLSFQLLLAPLLGLTPEEVGTRIAFVWSGGTEGVLSPHATIFTRSPSDAAATPRLALGIGVTRDLAPEEIGRMATVETVAAAVRDCLAQTGIADPAAVHYVQVKGPLLTPARIADARARGAKLATEDPNGSKAFARRLDLYSSVASTSAGGELKNCEVLLFGNSPAWGGDYRIGHATLSDVIDADGVRAALASAGLAVTASVSPADAMRIAAVFAKAEASPTGAIRGRRNTMLSDADINYERHARAALGAVIASVTLDPAIFVSGGTEHQCTPGAAPIAAIVRV
jgi:cyanuric acid amidohydrolase